MLYNQISFGQWVTGNSGKKYVRFSAGLVAEDSVFLLLLALCTSSFHFLTTNFAFCDTAASSFVLNFPNTLPISVFYSTSSSMSRVTFSDCHFSAYPQKLLCSLDLFQLFHDIKNVLQTELKPKPLAFFHCFYAT